MPTVGTTSQATQALSREEKAACAPRKSTGGAAIVKGRPWMDWLLAEIEIREAEERALTKPLKNLFRRAILRHIERRGFRGQKEVKSPAIGVA